MVSFELDSDQESLVQLTRTIAEREFRPNALEWGQSQDLPWDNIKTLSRSGLLGLSVDDAYGGGGRSPLDSLLAVEAVASNCPKTGTMMASLDLGPTGIINHHGSEVQKRRYLTRLTRGEILPAVSLTESGAGSDLTALSTRAEIVGDECIINGSKTFCSYADKADLFVVYVRFGPGLAGIGGVLVERDSPGLLIGPTRYHMGGSTWAELNFQSCTIPVSNILPLENGFKDLISSYNLERCGTAIKSIGIAAMAMDIARAYVNNRIQFSKRIAEFQGIRWKFAEMHMRLEAARLLTYRAAANAVAGKPSRIETSMAKVAATEAASFVCDEAIQVCGASGVSVDGGVEWLFRLVRGYRIGSGASEVHRDAIGREVLSWE